jgi:hypothetical protein
MMMDNNYSFCFSSCVVDEIKILFNLSSIYLRFRRSVRSQRLALCVDHDVLSISVSFSIRK